MDQALDGLREGRIRDVSLVLVELARCKKASGRDERFMEFIDNGGFANTRVARNKNEFRSASAYDTVEGRQQGIDFGRSPVQFLGNERPVRLVVLAKRKVVYAAMSFPFLETPLKVTLQARCRPVSLFSGFGE